jgi:hypothetical protein
VLSMSRHPTISRGFTHFHSIGIVSQLSFLSPPHPLTTHPSPTSLSTNQQHAPQTIANRSLARIARKPPPGVHQQRRGADKRHRA